MALKWPVAGKWLMAPSGEVLEMVSSGKVVVITSLGLGKHDPFLNVRKVY